MEPAKQRKISEEGRARISASRVGKKWSQEVKDKISASKKGTICSAEHRSKLSAAGKGRTPWNKGIRGLFKHSDEAKEKMADAQRGRKRPPEVVERIAEKLRGRTLSEEHKEKLREKRKGKSPGLGRKQSPEEKQKRREISLRVGNKPPSAKGRKYSDEARANMSAAQKKRCQTEDRKGEKAGNWRGGIAPKNRKTRDSAPCRAWVKAVLKRDGKKCRNCGAIDVPLQAHHIKEFSKHPDLRFDINNGLTLCKPCHHAVHGRKYHGVRVKINSLLTAQVPAT